MVNVVVGLTSSGLVVTGLAGSDAAVVVVVVVAVSVAGTLESLGPVEEPSLISAVPSLPGPCSSTLSFSSPCKSFLVSRSVDNSLWLLLEFGTVETSGIILVLGGGSVES